MRHALGYYIRPRGFSEYFVQTDNQLREQSHYAAFANAVALVQLSEGGLDIYNGGVIDVRPVYDHQQCPSFVVVFDLVGALGTFYTQWTPASPLLLENDHLGKIRYRIVDFATTKEEAMHIVQCKAQEQSKCRM